MRTAALALVAAAGVAAAQPADFIDLGVLTGDVSVSGSFDAGVIQWYRFELPAGASFAADTYLDLSTNGSINPDLSGADTEIGLFNGAGDFLVTDDDDGIGLTSVLSFGSGSGLLLGDSFNLGGDGIANGEDGDLAGGVYFVAIGEFNTTFGAGFSASGGDEAVDYNLDIFTNIPAPSSVALLGLGGLVATRRRR